MASQQDLQELLRLLTVGRKVPMLQAMAQVKALQAVELHSIKEIAEAPLRKVEAAINDDKAARALQSACKAALKRGDLGGDTSTGGTKRSAPNTGPASKRSKQEYTGDFMNGPVEMTPQELESSLELPISTDENRIAETVLQTNRAPLVLAFAVELLRYTMPEQPLSSRLSLAQAVVSANSRSKAVSIGLDKGPSADEEGWGEGQPRVRVMGREIAVLKRSGYEWRGEETVEATTTTEGHPQTQSQSSTTTLGSSLVPTQSQTHLDSFLVLTQSQTPLQANPANTISWATSQPISLKSSTFIARATSLTDPAQRKALIQSLLSANPNLKTATHNAWAYRVRPSEGQTRIREESFDDGETGCGELMLRIMREVNAVDTIVVLSRWFGGIMLGPDRWRLMRNCVTSALSERLRLAGNEVALGGEAVWGLDLEAARNKSAAASGMTTKGYGKQQVTGVVGMQIHSPQGARGYLMKSFVGVATAQGNGAETGEATSPTGGKTKKKANKSQKEMGKEKEENVGLLLGALRIVFDSWADHLTASELDRKAWSWYVAVRPDVESGPGGWGAKGVLKLKDILDLRRWDSVG
ncbi:hypothetical protein B0H66DRAFT_292124 [Apodospora peruviana]|uniref:Impact N-terminal domain-containing protein n=1 Tax=Apodospora peruviana TaxID=516989 RepID=A0AAE0I0J8_9PEZI|nr:hypothetical protein B0H66DRAFT_292124 [Apodospora peruviana]